MTTVYIALGSNLDNPLLQIETAIASLKTLPNSTLIKHSQFYRTPPMGAEGQSDYLNAVAELQTELNAENLLQQLQQIENNQTRTRGTIRWSARTLDLDILLFGNEIIQTTTLTIPHYDMYNRAFVLLPLFEIVPSLQLPDGSLLSNWVTKVSHEGISKWYIE